MLVHPIKNEKNTLIDHFPKAKLVHRLDKDTSGLIILAKNSKIQKWLKRQFKNRRIIKKYLALAWCNLKDEKGIITKSISRSKNKNKIQTTSPIGKQREAITRYKVLKEYNNYSLLEVMPKTGRTHQIRVHLSSIGCPVAGDKKYKFKRQPCPKNLKRQFLHAKYLKFALPGGEILEFNSNLPDELNKVLQNL